MDVLVVLIITHARIGGGSQYPQIHIARAKFGFKSLLHSIKSFHLSTDSAKAFQPEGILDDQGGRTIQYASADVTLR